jgi:Na+/melibiose symporter-like transporter
MSPIGSRSDRTAIPAALVGTGVWIVAFLTVTVTVGPGVPEAGVWWWGACMVGVASCVIGLVFLRWRRARLLRSAPSS